MNQIINEMSNSYKEKDYIKKWINAATTKLVELFKNSEKKYSKNDANYLVEIVLY